MINPIGQVFSLASDNPPIPGCTLSGALAPDVVIFSLARDTDISPESYPTHKLWVACQGEMLVLVREEPSPGEGKNGEIFLKEGELSLIPPQIPIGIAAHTDSVYVEILLRKETIMNPLLKEGQIFALKDLLPYQEGKIVNMDIVRNESMKFVVMAFDKGTGLSEHAAPGDAVIFALEGKGIIGYEGKEYPIQAGENFRFAKNGAHYVKADGRFKMALLLTLKD